MIVTILLTLLVVIATAYFFSSGVTSANDKSRRPSESTSETNEDSGDKKKEAEPKPPPEKHASTKKQRKPGREKAHDPSKKNPERYLRRFGGHQKNITCAALSPDGQFAATACTDGQLRVTTSAPRDGGGNPNGASELQVSHRMENSDRMRAMSWLNDNRTLACVVAMYNRPDEVALFRIRKKKAEAPQEGYEIVELVKRRFSTSESKFLTITGCAVDQSPGATECDLVILTGDSEVVTTSKTTSAYDCKTGKLVGGGSAATIPHGGGDVRLSGDATFMCGRRYNDEGAKRCTEIKIHEIVKKRHKGTVEPQFDSVSNKSVMTLPTNRPVADVDFFSSSSGCATDRALVCTADGAFQVWKIDVEYKRGEDPKLEYESFVHECLLGKYVVAIATSSSRRIAVATADCSIHLFSYGEERISHDFTMKECHGPKGIDDLFFDPTPSGEAGSGTILYSRGTLSKDVFAWNVA